MVEGARFLSTKTVTLLALLAMLVTGCQLPAAALSLPVATAVEPAGDSPAVDEPAEVVGGDIDLAADDSYGLTNHRLDGNRVVEGYTDLSQITPIDVKLDGSQPGK